MKKLCRFAALCLSLLLICLAFTGCMDFDEARKRQGFWQNEERDTILLNGKEYRLLPDHRLLDPYCETLYDYWITDADVPLLCMENYGENASLSADGDFIILESTRDSSIQTFCATDRYEEISKRMNETVIDGFCYEYENYDSEDDYYKTALYIFTEDEVDAVLTARESGKQISRDVYDSAECIITVDHCSNDGVFRTYSFDLVINVTNAYIVVDGYDEDYEETNLEPRTIVVPDELYGTFRMIAEKYMTASEYAW